MLQHRETSKTCKRHQTQKTTYCMTPFTWDVQERHTDTEHRLEVAWGWEQELTIIRHEGSDKGDCSVLKMNGLITAQLGKFTENHCILYFKWVNVMVCKLYVIKFFLKKGKIKMFIDIQKPK